MGHGEESGCCKGSSASQGSCCGGSGSGGGSCCKSGGAAAGPLPPLSVDELMALPFVSLVARFRRGIENFDRRVFDLSERQIDQAFLPDAGVGRWPVRVLIGHVADADLAAIHRMRRAVAEDNPLISEWDENAFVDSNIYGNVHQGYNDDPEADQARVMHALGGFMATIHTLRQWTGHWLMTLSDAQLERTTLHPQLGVLTVRKIVAMYTWHLEHHARFLTLKLDRLIGAVQEPAAAGAGSCGCKH